MTARLSIRQVSRRFGDFVALDTVSLEIAAGEFVVLLGPSGCGKTTLLSILGGFLAPSAGSVFIGEADMTHVPPARRPTTTMFQDYALFPHMTLIDNVGFGLRMAGRKRAERDAAALAMLSMVGLPEAGRKKPHELSGGQRQRVALARALAVEPDVLLLDEPLGALDLKLRRQMQDELKAIQRRLGTTFVHVTHDQEEAMAIADRIVVMNRGRIEDEGAPSRIYMRPRSRFAAGFMGEINVIDGIVLSVAERECLIETALGNLMLPLDQVTTGPPAPGDRISLAIRPESFRAGSGATDLVDLGEGQVSDSAFFGTHVRCHIATGRLPGQRIVAHLPQTSVTADGMTVTLSAERGGIVALKHDEPREGA